ncbi:MAG: biotin--[acetyl-CoA-carboxylase] ligase [Candidatus Omnitrophica bacterium]|nr:biotin--[acetyl-CoA-carboxylase] ligase [Candidatus Omnitrophota bacterium]
MNIDSSILEELKKSDSHVSGEWLAQKFNITRQGLWKHIDKLIRRGYEIIAVPHLGYKLVSVPDKLYPREIQYKLNTKVIGKEIHYYEIIGSTQDCAWQLGLANSDEGALVVSEAQTKGRGRMQRAWISSKGGIYMSLLLRPQFLHLYDASKITLLISLGCVYGIKKATGIDCQLKWPNDIFIEEKKVAGILCEINAETDKINFIVAGIGVNVNTRDLPKEATSLFLHTANKHNRVAIVKAIIEEIENCYKKAKKEGFDEILKEWSQLCFIWKRQIKVRISNRQVTGEAIGIDESGFLLLRKSTGLIEKIPSGDITKMNESRVLRRKKK